MAKLRTGGHLNTGHAIGAVLLIAIVFLFVDSISRKQVGAEIYHSLEISGVIERVLSREKVFLRVKFHNQDTAYLFPIRENLEYRGSLAATPVQFLAPGDSLRKPKGNDSLFVYRLDRVYRYSLFVGR